MKKKQERAMKGPWKLDGWEIGMVNKVWNFQKRCLKIIIEEEKIIEIIESTREKLKKDEKNNWNGDLKT